MRLADTRWPEQHKTQGVEALDLLVSLQREYSP
jgi:hypothetical protein